MAHTKPTMFTQGVLGPGSAMTLHQIAAVLNTFYAVQCAVHSYLDD